MYILIQSLNSDKQERQLGLLSLTDRQTCSKSHHLYNICSKCPPPARTQARRRWRHSPTARSITAWFRYASFQLVNIRDLGTIYSLVKHTPHAIVDRVEVGRVRRPERGWDKTGVFCSSSATVFDTMWWGTVLQKYEKLASRMSGSSIPLKTMSR